MFWSSPKYSIDCSTNLKTTNNNFTAFLKPDFKDLFLMDTEEFKLLKKAERKFIIGNFAFAVPGGICLGLALAGHFDNSTKNCINNGRISSFCS